MSQKYLFRLVSCKREYINNNDNNKVSREIQDVVWHQMGMSSTDVPNSPSGSCGRTDALNLNALPRAYELCESRGGRPGLPVPNSSYGLCGRKATLNSLKRSGAV